MCVCVAHIVSVYTHTCAAEGGTVVKINHGIQQPPCLSPSCALVSTDRLPSLLVPPSLVKLEEYRLCRSLRIEFIIVK